MIVVRSIAELQLPRHGVVGLVPTMGALHDGHGALFAAARPECDVLVASLFVNPAQFSDPGDLARYPGDIDEDAAFASARGVATVCLKLFNVVRPAVAWFGRKDAQQVAVVKQLVRDLNVPVEIRVVPTVRDADGLALSSRNARLSPAERAQALAIPRALETRDAPSARAVLEAAGLHPDYVEVANLDGQTLVLAARVGSTRLIDNLPLRKGDSS